MTGKQQVAVIEDLTKIISNEMGLREQMEVIRIINPVASISSNDTEFVIGQSFEMILHLTLMHKSPASELGWFPMAKILTF